MHKPRPYQSECITATLDGFREHRRQMIVVPTGGGKTYLMAEIARDFVERTGKPVLCIAHRDKLIGQNERAISDQTGLWVSREQAEHHGNRMSQVVVASIQSLGNRLASWPADHFGLVMVDEFHHAPAESYRRVLEHFQSACLLGVTATPDRSDKKRLGTMIDNIPYQINTFELIDQGYLAPIMVQHVPISIDISQVRVANGEYRPDDLDDAITPYLEEIVRSIREHAPTRKIIAFVPLVKTSQVLADVARRWGINAEHTDGSDPDQLAKLERFHTGQTQMLTNASLLLEGYDEPSIDCVLMLRPTKSATLYRQAIGRGARLHPGKENLLLLDYLWQTEKHGLVGPAHLIAETEEEAEAITRKSREQQTMLALGALSDDVRAEREQKLAEELKRNQRRSSRLYDARELGLMLHDPEIYEFEPLVAWQASIVTEKQRAMLERHGIDPATIKSRGHASKVIDAIITRRQKGLCALRQMSFLNRLGYADAENTTFGQAHALISRGAAA